MTGKPAVCFGAGRSGRTFVGTQLLTIVFSLSVLTGFLSAAEGPAGKFTAVYGDVTCVRPGHAGTAARPGSGLQVGDLLRTGRDGRAQVVLADDSVVNLSPGSAVRVDQFALEGATNRRSAVVKVLEGTARVVVHRERSRESGFTVVTPHALVSFAYADLVVTASASGTTVAVLDGSAGVSSSSPLAIGRVRLGDNQGTTVREKVPPSDPFIISAQQRRKYSSDVRQF